MATLSKRQRKLLNTYARGNRPIKCREEQELRDLGLIGYHSGPVEGGGYAAYPGLTTAGVEAARNVVIRCNVLPSAKSGGIAS